MKSSTQFPTQAAMRYISAMSLVLMLIAPHSSAFGQKVNFLEKASGSYIISPQSIITNFSVGQLPFGAITGRFLSVSGKFILNSANIKLSSAFLTIKPNSVKTKNPETDIYLRGPDFFHVKKFPVATFTSTAVEATGKKTAKLTGILKIKNTSLPITFNVDFLSARKDPAKNKKLVLKFNAHGSFERSQYGMEAGIPIFSDTVDLNIQVSGIKK